MSAERTIPIVRGAAVHMRAAAPGAACAVHDWPTEGLAPRLIVAMRTAFGRGGVDVCHERLHALGNAVVPWCAYAGPGAFIADQLLRGAA